jgi:hypothetical protein
VPPSRLGLLFVILLSATGSLLEKKYKYTDISIIIKTVAAIRNILYFSKNESWALLKTESLLLGFEELSTCTIVGFLIIGILPWLIFLSISIQIVLYYKYYEIALIIL